MNPRQDITPPQRRIISPTTRPGTDDQPQTTEQPLAPSTHPGSIAPLTSEEPKQPEALDEQPAPPATPEPVPELANPPQPATPAATPQTSAAQPSTSAGIVVGGPGSVDADSKNPETKPKRRRLRKNTLVILIAILLVLLLSAGLVFGLYLPNRPENVYKTGFSRTGIALERITDQATEDQALEQYKQSKIESSLKVAGPDDTGFDASFTTDFDDTSSDSTLSVKSEDSQLGPIDLEARVLTILPKEGLYPDIYLQISGIAALGLDSFVPGINQYDNKWIAISSEYLQSTVGSIAPGVTAADTAKTPTSADISELSNTFFDVSNEYLFTANADKAIFKQESFIGKEKVDDQNLYHYRVSVNVANAKAYCVALSDRILSTNAYKNISGDEDAAIKTAKEQAKKDCLDDEAYKEANDPIYDLWIDAKYKLIQKVRATDREKQNNYVELGQTYKGGDDLNFFSRIVNGENDTDVALNLKTNMKELTTTGTVKGSSGKAENRYSFDGRFNASASKDAVTVTKPSDAITIETIMESFLAAPSFDASSSMLEGSRFNDEEFRSDSFELENV